MEKCFAGKSASLLHTHIYQASKGGIQVSSDNKRWNTSKCVKQEAPLPRSIAVSHQGAQGVSNAPLRFPRTIHNTLEMLKNLLRFKMERIALKAWLQRLRDGEGFLLHTLACIPPFVV